MPIYEYKCDKCGHSFEDLVKNGQKIKCPKCQSGQVKKKFSSFGKRSSDKIPSGSSSSCSGCTSTDCGSCGAA